MANRAELEQAVDDGCAVEITGYPHPVRGAKAMGKALAALGDAADGMEGVVVRDAQGRLTHDGMKLYVGRGESVMHEGEIISDASQIPHPAVLAKGDAKKLAAVESDLDRRQALLDAERARVARARETAAAAASATTTTADEDAVHADFAHLSAADLKAMCEDNDCVPEGRATKAKMAEALAAKGVKPPKG
jgi:hypothetical protein